jgi:heparinase II/III-like protein
MRRILRGSRVRRTVARVARMSPAEVRHRAAVEMRRRLGWLPWMAAAADRDDPWVARLDADSTARAGLAPALGQQLAVRLYGKDWSPARLAGCLRAAGGAERIVAEAAELRAHRVRLLGYGVRELGPRIDWHRDPVTGFRWPARHWGRIDRGLGDGKVIWELNRHQHFLVLGAAAALTGDAAYADEVAEQLAGWIEQNATGIGIHWLESMEPALRVLGWLWALPLVVHAPRFTPDLCLRVLRSLVAQARHVAANLSTYSSPNTHLLAEALALFVVGTALPELEVAAEWRNRARTILEREIDVQVGEDGFYREASTYYHAYAVELYLLAVIVAERNDVTLAPTVRGGLERMLEALAWLTRPDGSLPNVGDADGGRTLRLGAPNLSRVDELLASGAVVTERAELRAGLPATGIEAAWLWPDGLERVQRLGGAAAPRGSRHFPQAALAVDRRRVAGDERWTLFDAGDLGMLSGGHGHAGCLGLGLYAQGRALIVDRGTHVYNGAPAWRQYFRGTRAHSTVVIDGREQAEPAGTFRWATRYTSRIVRHVSTSDYTLVTAQHDGYRRLPVPLIHERTLLGVGGEYWVCIDRFTGAGTHSGEFLFQLAPGLEIERAGVAVFAAPPEATAGLLIVPAGFEEPRTHVEIAAMAAGTRQGWHSDDYGERRPAPTLTTTDMLVTPAVRAHVLAPCARTLDVRPVVHTQQLDHGLAITVHRGDSTDLVLCSTAGPRRLAAAGATFVGELLHARVVGGDVRRFLAVQARSLDWNGGMLMRRDHAADWVAMDEEQLLERA